MASFALQSRHMGFQQLIEQLLSVHVVQLGYFIVWAFRSLRAIFKFRQAQAGLLLAILECGEPPFQSGADRPGAGDHQALHQDHQKADVALLFAQGLVVALAHVVGYSLIEELLQVVTALPGHRGHLRAPGFKERLAVGINGLALLGADDVRSHPLAGDALHIRKGVVIQQAHQTMEGIGLALVRRGRKEQHIGRGFRQSPAELVAGDLIGAAAQAVRFVHDHQIPTGGNQILEPAAVVFGDALGGPAAPLVHGFDRIQGDDDLIEHRPG